MICNVQGHQAHCALVAVGHGPTLSSEQDTQRRCDDYDDKGSYPVDADTDFELFQSYPVTEYHVPVVTNGLSIGVERLLNNQTFQRNRKSLRIRRGYLQVHVTVTKQLQDPSGH